MESGREECDWRQVVCLCDILSSGSGFICWSAGAAGRGCNAAPSQVCAEEGIQGLGLTMGGLLTHPWESVPKASRATVLRGSQCPRKVCGGFSSLTKTEVGDAAMEMGS